MVYDQKFNGHPLGLEFQAELFFDPRENRRARGGLVGLRTIRRPFEREIEEALKTGLVDYDSVQGSVGDSRFVGKVPTSPAID